jgi:hypothetical protein
MEQYNPLDLPLKKQKYVDWENRNKEIIKEKNIDIKKDLEEPIIKPRK